MAFRDDREALRQRTAELEAELDAAERQLDQQREQATHSKLLKEELVRTRERLHAMEKRLGGRSGANTSVILVVVLVGLFLGAGVVAFALVRTAPPPPVAPFAGEPPAVVQPGAVAPTPPTPATPLREVKTSWKGRVKTATGMDLKPGTECELSAVLRSPSGTEVALSCGGSPLYKSTDQLNGMSQHSHGIGELPGPEAGPAVHYLKWDDIGSRTGARSQASIDTKLGVAAAWRETQPNFRVEVEMESLSQPASGTLEAEHSDASLPFAKPLTLSSKAASVTGPAPVKAGAACSVALTPAWGPDQNCRAVVSCGDKVLYGDHVTGFNKCELADNAPSSFDDSKHDDADGVFVWKRGGPAKVAGMAGDQEWTVELAP
ncbi:MAG: hypothetical protein HOV80_27910 [Polyangiaceae bacterium]|nr:hypothetical protein [Polyangiaceae bacterium]